MRDDASKSVDGVHVDVFFFQAEDGIRDYKVTGVQTCALPILTKARKKTKIDFQTIMAAARSAMALRTMASITRIKKKLSPQIKQNQARRRKSRRSNWRWARKASRKVSLWRTREIWTEQKARINPLMKTRWSGR